ncbi:MFS transporter [Halolamina salifodinae]|uniref:MFS family permease n=1 Tax=Halolamina salifodinae TaxID=1202767 RepID=A0A8T4GYS8_9EURY|nr:MFS transporter [Halolamina salifodinae]MBP1987303.1 MFS family permease [Halolamina salifodinae]
MRRPSLDAVRGFDRAVYIVAAGQLLNVFGSGLVYPFATIHFHLEIGIALSLVGLGLLVKSVGTAVATTVGGYLADRIGRKPVMVAAMAGNAVTLAGYAFVPAIAAATPLDAAGAFIGVSALSGATNGLYTPAGQAYIADLTEGAERDRAYSLLKVGNNVGFGMGFVVGGLLYEWAEVAVFLADGFTSAVVAVLLVVLVPRIHAGQPGVAFRDSVGDWTGAVTKRRVLALAALNGGFSVLYAQMQTTVPIVAEARLGLSSAEIGTLYVLNPLTLVLLQIPLVAAVTDWRRTRGLTLSTGFWAVSMLVVWLIYLLDLGPAPVGRHSLLALGVVLVGAHLVTRTIGEVLHSPISTSLMSALGSDGERGAQLSVLEVAKRGGMGVGSFAGGLFFDYGLAAWLWPTLIGLCVLLAVGLLTFERTLSPRENGAPVEG